MLVVMTELEDRDWVRLAADRARRAGCEWLHVDFGDDVADVYDRRCGFQPTNAGLLAFQDGDS